MMVMMKNVPIKISNYDKRIYIIPLKAMKVFYKHNLVTLNTKLHAILDKAKPHTENIKGLNLAAVIYMTVQVSRLLWKFELILTN
jgi:hypothetical protein